ncbi:Unknown protein [Striga hermonthica]|uniref:Glycine-rich protein n=1 Tax=Striga hermonthica TaxID=68872 RepID=A0A9N7R0H3_STRHE|nr:Unknown protein [Striga hermonthica]
MMRGVLALVGNGENEAVISEMGRILEGSGLVYMLGMIVLSISIMSVLILACVDDGLSRKNRRNMDGGGGGGGNGGGDGDGGGCGGGCGGGDGGGGGGGCGGGGGGGCGGGGGGGC